jgi:hypothetical protein
MNTTNKNTYRANAYHYKNSGKQISLTFGNASAHANEWSVVHGGVNERTKKMHTHPHKQGERQFEYPVPLSTCK